MKRILFYGPETGVRDAAYGGGVGGVVRNIDNFSTFRSERFYLVPFGHTVRAKKRTLRNLFPVRLLIDVIRFMRACLRDRPEGIHMLAQYRMATPREFAIVVLARLFGIRVLYHIKAGVFIDWYRGTNASARWMMRRIIARSRLILCEGMPYLDFVRETFGRESHYFPNYVLDEEVPASPGAIFGEACLRVIYVGFCYEGKGVFELVDGCDRAAREGLRVRLSLVGSEHPDFTAWLDDRSLSPNLELIRHGLQPHDRVLELYRCHDIFCMPTRHPGEGHNNATNEAMMLGLCILVTRHGFLESILDEASAIFLEGDLVEAIAEELIGLNADREKGRRLGAEAFRRLMGKYTSGVLFPRLEEHYQYLLGAEKRP